MLKARSNVALSRLEAPAARSSNCLSLKATRNSASEAVGVIRRTSYRARLAFPGLSPCGDVEVIADHLARQMDGGNTQPACANFCPHVKSLSLIGFGLRGITEWEPGRDHDSARRTRSCGRRFRFLLRQSRWREGSYFVGQANKGAQEVGEQDAATTIEVAERLFVLPA